MLLKTDTQAAVARRHSQEGCVEFPLLLLDGDLAKLELIAKAEKRTIGQMIRETLGRYLAGACGECGAGGGWANSQPDLVPDGAGVLAVTLLLPRSQLAELESRANQCETAVSVLIRRVVCGCLLPLSPNQPPQNES
jgi:hypothetical protein